MKLQSEAPELPHRHSSVLKQANLTSCPAFRGILLHGESRVLSELYRLPEDGEDRRVEESEVAACERRADESVPAQKPVGRAKLEARADSVQVSLRRVAPNL